MLIVQKKKEDSNENEKIKLTQEIIKGFKDFLILKSMRTSKLRKQQRKFDNILEYFIKIAIQIQKPDTNLIISSSDFVEELWTEPFYLKYFDINEN